MPLLPHCTLFQSFRPNKMLPLAMPSVSCDACTGATASHDLKSHVTPSLKCLYLMKQMMPLMMQLALMTAMPVLMASHD